MPVCGRFKGKDLYAKSLPGHLLLLTYCSWSLRLMPVKIVGLSPGGGSWRIPQSRKNWPAATK